MARAKKQPAPKRSPKTQKSAPERRRSVVLIGGALLVAGLMLFAWFPASAILSQRQALSRESNQLATMKSQDAVLIHEESTLTSPGDVTSLAREEYQLVEPGQQLVQVLPPSGTPTASGSGQAPYPGDPGLTKPVAPSAIALLPTETTTTTTPIATPLSTKSATHSTTVAAKAGPKSLIQRIVATLSFWKS